MLNFFKKILKKDKNTEGLSENELIDYATTTLLGTGKYASYSLSDDWQKWAKKMQVDLLLFEKKAFEYSSPKLFILTGKGW
jgi:hypothetical protein